MYLNIIYTLHDFLSYLFMCISADDKIDEFYPPILSYEIQFKKKILYDVNNQTFQCHFPILLHVKK